MLMIFFYYVLLAIFILPNLWANNPTIHIFGDSHACYNFSNSLDPITRNEQSYLTYTYNNSTLSLPLNINWFGSKTMYNIGNNGLNTLNITKFNVNNGDIAVFVFGEIDVRCHIGKQCDIRHRSLEEVIDSLAHNYIKTLLENQSLFAKLHCVIAEIVPPSNNGFNPAYPYYGTLAERVSITSQLNTALKKKCKEHAIAFLELNSLYANADGSLNAHLSDGCVHINKQHNTPIKNNLMELIITSCLTVNPQEETSS